MKRERGSRGEARTSAGNVNPARPVRKPGEPNPANPNPGYSGSGSVGPAPRRSRCTGCGMLFDRWEMRMRACVWCWAKRYVTTTRGT